MSSEKTRPRKSKKIPDECEICCNEYNQSTRKKVDCQHCHYTACSGCLRHFMLSSYQEPHCMKCKTAWSREFWMEAFPKVFVHDEFKKHRENILLEREKSLLPLSQPDAERISEMDRIRKINQKLHDECNIVRIQLYQFQNNDLTDEEIYNQKKPLAMKIAELDFEVNHNNNLIARLANRHSKSTERNHIFVRACPSDGCKGMLSTQWKCGLCGIFVCNQCHEIIGDRKDAPHTCKPENVETAKLLNKDTKPCPQCASLIFRISGCTSMFCTNCKHSFDWITGRTIDYAHAHNPHLFEFLATRNHAPINNNEPCGGLPNQYELQTKCRQFRIPVNIEVLLCQRLLSAIRHNNDIVMRRYRIDNDVNDNNDIRVQFLLNQIDEEKFKRLIHCRDKSNAKKLDIYRIMELFDTVSRDLLIRLKNATSFEDIMNIHTEVKNLVQYANKQNDIIGKRYKNIIPMIDIETFRWM